MEHWALEEEVLREHARHYQTGAPIPAQLIERGIRAAATFNKAYETVEYSASAAWWTRRCMNAATTPTSIWGALSTEEIGAWGCRRSPR